MSTRGRGEAVSTGRVKRGSRYRGSTRGSGGSEYQGEWRQAVSIGGVGRDRWTYVRWGKSSLRGRRVRAVRVSFFHKSIMTHIRYKEVDTTM